MLQAHHTSGGLWRATGFLPPAGFAGGAATTGAGVALLPPEAAGVQRYATARPQVGHVDVLYADDDLLVTLSDDDDLRVARRKAL